MTTLPLLEDVLVGLGEFEVRLVRNRKNVSYRETALVLWDAKVAELERYGVSGLMEHYVEWGIVYRRLWP